MSFSYSRSARNKVFLAIERILFMMDRQLQSLPLLLGQIFPVLHGHAGFLESRVFTVGDGDGFEEGLPHCLHLFFVVRKGGCGELFDGTELECALIPAGGGAAADVVEEPVLRLEPAAEVVGEGLDNVVVRLHFSQVGAVLKFFEPQEPLHAVEFPTRFFGYGDNFAHRRVGEVAVDLVAMDKGKREEVEQAALHPLFFGKHEGVESMGCIGSMLAEPEKKRFGLDGVGAEKKAIFEKSVLALCKSNQFRVWFLFENPGNCGKKTIGGAVVEVSVHGVMKKFQAGPVVLKVPVPGYHQGAIADGEGLPAGLIFRNFCRSR